MKRLLLSSFFLAVFSSCSGIFPGFGIHAPESLSGYRMDFSDLKGTHEYLFANDGSYREKCTPADSSKVTSRKGTWQWKRNSPSRAVLTLDGIETLNFRFTTDDHANGTFGSAGMMYAFEFTRESTLQ